MGRGTMALVINRYTEALSIAAGSMFLRSDNVNLGPESGQSHIVSVCFSCS